MIKASKVTFLLIFSVTISFAQQRTLYQKQVDEIKLSVIKSLRINQVTINKFLPNKIDVLFKSDAVQSRFNKLSKQENEKLNAQFSYKMRNARRLMKQTDFKRESDEKKAAEISQQKWMRLAYSDYSRVQQEASTKYYIWREKGEFEKVTDYTERILNDSETTFKNICYAIIKSALDQVKFVRDIGKYDAENESYMVSFWLENFEIPQSSQYLPKLGSSDPYRYGFNVNLHIPISEAPSFKENFQTFEVDVQPDDWTYIDGYISPTKLKLIDRKHNKSYNCEFSKGEKISQSIMEDKLIVFDYSSVVIGKMQGAEDEKKK